MRQPAAILHLHLHTGRSWELGNHHIKASRLFVSRRSLISIIGNSRGIFQLLVTSMYCCLPLKTTISSSVLSLAIAINILLVITTIFRHVLHLATITLFYSSSPSPQLVSSRRSSSIKNIVDGIAFVINSYTILFVSMMFGFFTIFFIVGVVITVNTIVLNTTIIVVISIVVGLLSQLLMQS